MTKTKTKTLKQSLDHLTQDELKSLIHCKQWCDVRKRFKTQQLALFSAAVKDSNNQITTNIPSRSLLAAIYGSCTVVDLVWALTSLVMLQAYAVPMMIGFSLLLLGVTLAVFYYSYRERTKEDKKVRDQYNLTTVQLAAHELIRERTIAVKYSLNRFAILNSKWTSHHGIMNPEGLSEDAGVMQPSAFNAISVGLTSVATVFISYYWGVSEIVLALGLIAAGSATAPFAVISVGVCALMIGAYFGYKHYQAESQQQLLASQTEQQREQVQQQCQFSVPVQNAPSVGTRIPRYSIGSGTSRLAAYSRQSAYPDKPASLSHCVTPTIPQRQHSALNHYLFLSKRVHAMDPVENIHTAYSRYFS